MQATLFDMPMPSLPERFGRATVRGLESRHIVTPAKGSTGDYDYTLNPYRGCTFACSYCYAASYVADEGQRQDWGKWVEIKTQAVDCVRAKQLYGRKVYMSSATDPYQPIEGRVRLTRRIVEELLRVQARLVIQTRSPLVSRDIDLFKQFRSLRVNLSITTDDDEMRKRFEPECASIERRLEAARQLRAAGIRVAVCLCPMLPLKNPIQFARTLRTLGPEHVAIGYFHVSDKAFTANTREMGMKLARDIGWNRNAYDQTVQILRRELASLSERGEAFQPV